MKITIDMLLGEGICGQQLAIYKKVWPKGGTVTLARCRRAVKLGLDPNWLVEKLMPADAAQIYNKAVDKVNKTYFGATDKAEWFHEAMTHTAYARHEAAKNKAQCIYNRAETRAKDIYDVKVAKAEVVLHDATALAFFRAVEAWDQCRSGEQKEGG